MTLPSITQQDHPIPPKTFFHKVEQVIIIHFKLIFILTKLLYSILDLKDDCVCSFPDFGINSDFLATADVYIVVGALTFLVALFLEMIKGMF